MHFGLNLNCKRSPLLLFVSCVFTAQLYTLPANAQKSPSPVRDLSKPMTAAQQPGHSAPLKPDSAVLAGVLPNGLHYYIRHNTEPNNRAELRLVVNAGSVLEDPDQLGAAHFVEHLQFNGTAHFKKNELVNFLERAGSQFGADLNASTGFDETVYKLSVPTDSSRVNGSIETILNTGFQVLADWAGAATMETAAIDKERGIITEEWRLGRGAGTRMRDRYFKEIFKGSRYASRIPIGTKESINSITYEAIRRFYKDWYRPDLEAVVVVGDFDAAAIEKKIILMFSSIPKPVKPRLRTLYPVTGNKETLSAVESDPEQVYTIVQVYYKQPFAPLATTSDFHTALVRELFSAMIQSRLTEKMKDPNPPFLFGAAAYSHFLDHTDIYQAFAVSKSRATLLPAMESLVEENLRVTAQGFTAGELERAKADLLASVDKKYAEREKTNSKSHVDPLVNNFLLQLGYPSASFEYAFTHSELPSISLKEVNQQAAMLSPSQNRIALVLAPEKDKNTLPSPLQIRNVLDKKWGPKLKAYNDDLSSLPLIQHPIAGGSVSRRSIVLGTLITQLILGNGMRILVRPGNSTNDQVLFAGFSKGGISSYQDKTFLNAKFCAEILTDAGLGSFSEIQLGKKLAGKSLAVRPFVDDYQQGIAGSSSVKDLETAFQLIYLWFTSPSRDSSSFRNFVQKEADLRLNQRADPSYVFSDSVNAILSGHNPHKRFPVPEDIRTLKFSTAYAVFKQLFADPGDFTWVFTGNASPDTIERLAAKYLGGLRKTGEGPAITDDLKNYPGGPLDVSLKKGKEPKTQVRIYYTGTTTYDSTLNTRLSVLVNALEIRLRQILREDKGAVYGVGVSGVVTKIPRQRYNVSISFACLPAKAGELTKLVLDEISSMKARGLDPLVLEKVKAENKRSFETQLRENSFWLESISESLFLQESLLNIESQDKIFRSVSERDSKNLAGQFFKDQGRIIFRLDPEHI